MKSFTYERAGSPDGAMTMGVGPALMRVRDYPITRDKLLEHLP